MQNYQTQTPEKQNDLELSIQYKTYPDNMKIKLHSPITIELSPHQQLGVEEFNTITSQFKTRVSFDELKRESILGEDQNPEKFVVQVDYVQQMPFRFYSIIILLILIGFSFLAWGFYALFSINRYSVGLGFLILGVIMLISGIYHLIQIMAFKTAVTPEERERALSNFPQE